MSDNENKDIERDPTEASDESAADSPLEEATVASANADKATSGTDSTDAPDEDTAEAVSDEADAPDSGDDDEAADQTDPPSSEELAAAEAEVGQDANIEAGPNDPEDPSEFRNLVANAAGITGPDQPKEMFASEDPSLTDDELRARGMEEDSVPITPLVALVLLLTVVLGLISLGLLQLYRYVADDMLAERNWSVVDPALAEQRAGNRELLGSSGTAWGEAQEGEVRIPIAVAQSLLVSSPQWLERHPLAPAVEAAAAPTLEETDEDGVEDDADETADEADETLDSAEEDPTDPSGEAVEEQADQPSPAGDDTGAETPGEEDEE